MFGNLKVLPEPVGSFTVGITHMDFVDRSRSQVFSFESKDTYREIPVTIFYPADNSEGKNSASYSFPEALEEMSRMTYGAWSKNMAKIETQVYENIAISIKKDSFPVIFFNQGLLAYEMQSTVLCSDLASLGYIVISIGHPYESSAIKYTDGRIVRVSKHIENHVNSIFDKQYIKQIMQIKNHKGSFSDEKAIEVGESLYVKDYGQLSKNVRIWADDTLFIADILADLQTGKIESQFKNKLQLSRGFGITGASLGGGVAAQVCYLDERFKCGINMDGGAWGDYITKDIKTPFMTIGTLLMWNTCRAMYLNNSADSYIVVVDETEHWAYTDVIFGSRQAVKIGRVGVRDKYEFRDILTKFHVTFFEKYLLENCDLDLSTLEYNGIDIHQNKK